MFLKFKLLFTLLCAANLSAISVIDVRTLEEWNNGHLKNATHKEWQNILDITTTISKDETIYLYCRSGNRSGKATKILTENGFLNVINAGSIYEASKLLNTEIIL